MLGACKGHKGDWIISELAIAIIGIAFLTLFTPLAGKVVIWDGAFIDDAFGRFMKGLALIGSMVSLLLSREYMAREKIDQFEYPVLILLATTGMCMLISLPEWLLSPYVRPAVHGPGVRVCDVGKLHSILHNFVNTEPVGELVYWGFIVLPLVALRDKAVRLFGILIFVSIFLTWFTYSKTFNSVWCFYCAVLSIFVIWIVNRPRLSGSRAA